MIDEFFQNSKILIVDDEKANVRFLEIILQNAGYTNIYSLMDSREAVDTFHDLKPDLLLLDLLMPHLDGFGVMQQLNLKAAADPVPVLVLTADATAATKHRALREGANDFLIKPLDEIEVLLRIKNLLEIRFHNILLDQKIRERTRELEESREQLRALAASLTVIQETERTEIAREVHDQLGQALTGLKMDLAWLDKRISVGECQPDLLQPRIRDMYQHIDGTIRSVQQIAMRLRPALLDDLGLEAAVEWQLHEFQQRTSIRCECVSSLGDMMLPPEQATAVFRILQESLTNVARHAGATHVYILLEENNGNLTLEVQDNGRGLNNEKVAETKSLGLLGMQERASLVGGTTEIMGVEGKGTTVTVCVPLRKERSA